MKVFLRFFLVLLPVSFAAAQPWAPQETILTGSPNSFGGNTHSWADVDGDGDVDLFTEAGGVWLNNVRTSGSFNVAPGLVPGTSGGAWSAAFGDFDNDGKPDLHLAKGTSGTNSILVNRWPDPFADVAAVYGYNDTEFCQPAYWADYDNDGLLDLYVTHEIPGEAHEFWQNAYPADFIPRFPQGGGPDEFGLADLNSHAYGLTWGDIDIDGDIDVVTSACGSGSAIPDENPHNKVYENMVTDLDGTPGDRFIDRTKSVRVVDNAEIQAGSDDYWATLFDYDNDGFPDLFIGDNSGQHRLWHNTGKVAGDFGFELVDGSVHGLTGGGAYGHAALAGDYDNDGDLDLYLTRTGLFQNDGAGHFTLTNHVPSVGAFQDASWVDYDEDGWLDLYNSDDLYRNPGGSNHWLSIELEGDPDLGTTRGANGVKIRVTSGDLVQTREHRFMVATYSQFMLPTHFGLGTRTNVDEVRVFWPNGTETVLTDLAVDQSILIAQEADCTGELTLVTRPDIAYCYPLTQNLEVASTNGAQISWRVRSGPDTDAGQFNQTSGTHVAFTPSTPGTYELEVFYMGCPNTSRTVLLHDSDFSGNGQYGPEDLLVPLPEWTTSEDLTLYDLDGNGLHDVRDLLRQCPAPE